MENLFGVLPVAQHYSRLKATLKSWGYQIDPPARARDDLSKLIFYTFPYDWRTSFRDAAQKLKERIDELRLLHPDREIWLSGHSGGGIVSRWYLEKLGGNDVVSRLFLFASPWDGAPGALYHIINGYDKLFALPITFFNIPERTRETLRLFPSLYEIIPQARPFVYDADGAAVSPFDDADWLPDAQERALLAAGREFNRELGNTTHVDTVAFIGYNKPTRSEGRMTAEGGERWNNLQWRDADFIGDGTVPLYSAEYANARRYYAISSHDDIYENDEIKARLYYEVLGK
jgi:pimeloyl-ACP methyl ester carboxylesterase